MNLIEELQSLDANDVGRWPLPFRVAVIVIVFIVVTGLGIYWFIVKDKAPQLESHNVHAQRVAIFIREARSFAFRSWAHRSR